MEVNLLMPSSIFSKFDEPLKLAGKYSDEVLISGLDSIHLMARVNEKLIK